MNQPYGHVDFVRLTLAEFPSLRGEFDDDPELLHLQVHAFGRLVSRAKGEGDWVTYRRAMQLVDELWRRADDELLNALNVSFLEHLDFEGPNGPEAWRHLPPELQVGWRAIHDYMKELAEPAKSPRKKSLAPRTRKRR